MTRHLNPPLGIGAGLTLTVAGAVSLLVIGGASGAQPATSTVPVTVVAAGQGATTVAPGALSRTAPKHPAAAPQTSKPASLPPVDPSRIVVPKLRRLTPPDAVVRIDHAASHGAIARLRRQSGIRQVVALDRGSVTLPAGRHELRLAVAAAPVTAVRAFTPRITAASRPLWRSIARGELTVGFSAAQPLRHQLGTTLPLSTRKGSSQVRVGAFATIGVPGVQAVVSPAEARLLHLRVARELLIHAPKIPIDMLRSEVAHTIGKVSRFTVTRPQQFDQSQISSYAQSMIPATYLELYRRAAPTCPGLPWTVLAGIGTVETDNGRNVHRSIKGAEGPMQFMPATWAEWGVDADGDGKANIQDPVDAVFAAARYLCAAGASRGGQSLNDAIFAYNHAWWYVREVVDLANAYA